MTNMKSGDILIFEAGDNWLSKCIAKLTNSTVSHAAIRYSGDNMVEMGGSGISLSGCYEANNGDKAHLLRLSPEHDTEPLVNAAKHYLDEGVKYDFPDLVFFAGLLIYRSIRPTQRWQKITDLILNAACAKLDKLLNKIIHKGNKSPVMVCSQLVYQCYLDCGSDYEIILKDALLKTANSDKICLADLVNNIPDDNNAVLATPSEIPEDFNLENAACELYSALEETENETILKTADFHNTINSAKKFLDLVEKILKHTDVNIPIPALFVAPSDLLYHAENLTEYGTAFISRTKI